MDKDNIFKSCNFYLDDGDVVHVLIKDFVGDNLSISLNDNDGTQEDDTEITPYGELYTGKYGALYNWFAATDLRNICASGWRVTTHSDWETLALYLQPGATTLANTVGGLLKEVGFTYWNNPNTGATNSVNFNARGVGYRSGITGTYWNIGNTAYFMNTDEWPPQPAISVMGTYIRYDSDLFYTSIGANEWNGSGKTNGSAIRLIKNSTSLLDGETGIYTGNDGRVYNTICIGTQEWLSQNLAETKFRNGEDIPVIEDIDAWAALITAGMCYYDNVEV